MEERQLGARQGELGTQLGEDAAEVDEDEDAERTAHHPPSQPHRSLVRFTFHYAPGMVMPFLGLPKPFTPGLSKFDPPEIGDQKERDRKSRDQPGILAGHPGVNGFGNLGMA